MSTFRVQLAGHRKYLGYTLTAVALSVAALSPAALGAHPREALHLEKIEWTWADRSDPINSALPNVLLLGDSITRAYFPEVAKELAGRANVYLFATSCSAGDPRLVGQLRDYFRMEPTFSVVHFNNGMHGWAYTESEFAAALPSMVHAIREAEPKAHLIWATITPVRRDDSAGATNARIDARNADALKLMSHESIVIDDQHLLMAAHGDLHLDDVHFNEEGSKLEGDQAAKIIATELSNSGGKPN